MSFHFTKFGLSHLFQNQIDGYTGRLLNYMFDSFSCTSALVNITTNTFISVNSNLTNETIQYITSLAPYSNSSDLLSYLYTNSNLINLRNTDRALDYASNNNLELLIFGSFEGQEFGKNPTVKRALNQITDEDIIEFDSDIIEIGGGGAERKMLLASNFNKPLFCNILRYYISSFVNHNFRKYGTVVTKYIVMNESRTNDFTLPTSANTANMWHDRGMLKILEGDFIPFFFRAYGDALPPSLLSARNSLYYMEADAEFQRSNRFNPFIDQLAGFRDNGAPIHGFGFQAHCGDLLTKDMSPYDESINSRGPRDLRQFESNINYVRKKNFNVIIQEYDAGARQEYIPSEDSNRQLPDAEQLAIEIAFNNSLAHIAMNHGTQTFHNWYDAWGHPKQIQFINVCNFPIYGRNNRPTPIFKELHTFVKWYRTNRLNSFNSLATVYDYKNEYVGVFPSLKQVALSNNLSNIKFGIIVDNDSGRIEFTRLWRMDSIKYAFDIIVPPNCMKMEGLRNMNNNNNPNTNTFISSEQFTNILGTDFNSNRSFGFNGWNANINRQLFSNNTTTAANAIANYASNNNLKVRGHNLCWHTQQPQWLINMNNRGLLDSNIAKTILSNHVTTVIRHYYNNYGDTVTSWDVINELIRGYNPDDPDNESSFPRIVARVESRINRSTGVKTITNCNYLAYHLNFPHNQASIDNTFANSEVFRTAFNSAWSATPSRFQDTPSLFYNDFNTTTTTIDCLARMRGNYRTGNNPFQVGGIAIDGIGLQGYIQTHNDSEDVNNVYTGTPKTEIQLKQSLSTLYGITCYAIDCNFKVDITETVVDRFNAGAGYMYVDNGDYDNQLYAKVYRNWVRLCLYAGVNNFISWEHRIFDSNGNPTLYYNTIVDEVGSFPSGYYGTKPQFNDITLVTMISS